MAHIIAQHIGGPRAEAGAGPDTYDNLILLCPTCHTLIDKSPAGTYSASLLRKWKAEHELRVDEAIEKHRFLETEDLIEFLISKLDENKHFFWKYGPHSQEASTNPMSNSHGIWIARKLDTILPNNSAMLTACERHWDILPADLRRHFSAFKDHVLSFHQNQYHRADTYTLFPEQFEEAVRHWHEQRSPQ